MRVGLSANLAYWERSNSKRPRSFVAPPTWKVETSLRSWTSPICMASAATGLLLAKMNLMR